MYTFEQVGKAVVVHLFVASLLSLWAPGAVFTYTGLMLGIFLAFDGPIWTKGENK